MVGYVNSAFLAAEGILLKSNVISVVIPNYRSTRTLLSAIESVANQTLLPLEVIVVDDASNDGSIDIIRALQSTYDTGWLKLIDLKINAGAASARNVGWESALGTHIAFLDADDVWHSRKLELQWQLFEADPELTLSGHAFRFSWDDDVEVTPDLRSQLVSRHQVLLRNPFVTPSVMLRKNLPFRFRSGKRHMEDHLLWMEIVLSGHVVRRLDAPLATINKAQFGASGLSSQLWAMEKGELDNYISLRKKNFISTPTTCFLLCFSLVKFVRRLAIVAWRKFRVGPRQG